VLIGFGGVVVDDVVGQLLKSWGVVLFDVLVVFGLMRWALRSCPTSTRSSGRNVGESSPPSRRVVLAP